VPDADRSGVTTPGRGGGYSWLNRSEVQPTGSYGEMSLSERGDGWTVEIDDGVMVWEFLPGMEVPAFEEEAYPVYEDLLSAHDVGGLVTVVRIDDPFDAEAFAVWERSAQRAADAGVDRWAVVADGIKAISLRGQIDVGDLETLTTEDRTEAVEWAR
jgi:hypothetical protein